MKENELIIMKKKIQQLTDVVNGLIKKLQQVDQMAKGTLTAVSYTHLTLPTTD